MLITLDRSDTQPTLHQQIYDSLRIAILEGRLTSDTRLPGSRVLAEDLGVSRSTVLLAYEQLKAEGYLVGKRGGGTRISIEGAPARKAANLVADQSRESSTTRARLSTLGERMIEAFGNFVPPRSQDRAVPFALGVPAIDAFPVGTWARLSAQRWRKNPRMMLSPDDGPGFAPLRAAIAKYVVTARAVQCSPEQIVITAGGQQGIDLIARLLLNPGDCVWVEEYGYRPARAAFAGVGARTIDVPVDEQGLDVQRGRQLAPHAKLAFVTPAFEPPFGVTMSIERRIALLDWAEHVNAWVVEDDYNGELRYEGKSLAALQGLDHPGARRVIYFRTFTKTLFPALRLGYVVLPTELVDAFTRTRIVTDRHSPTAEQAVLADFIVGGHFARHVRSMRQLYAERQRMFLDIASVELDGLLRFRPASAGIRLVGFLPPGVSDQRVAAEAARLGIVVESLSSHRGSQSEVAGLVFGYAAFDETQIRRGFAQLAHLIREIQRNT
jgi:GntR family transcriptional regulator/MocR family aminotransferase